MSKFSFLIIALSLFLLGCDGNEFLELSSPTHCSSQSISQPFSVKMKVNVPQPEGVAARLVIDGYLYDAPWSTISLVVPSLKEGVHYVSVEAFRTGDGVVIESSEQTAFRLFVGENEGEDTAIRTDYLTAGDAFQENGHIKAAVSSYNCSCVRFPHDIESHLKLGHVLMLLRRFAVAKHIYAHSHWLNHQHAHTRFYRAISQYYHDREQCFGEELESEAGIVVGLEDDARLVGLNEEEIRRIRECKLKTDEVLVEGFASVLDAGLMTVDAHHLLWEESGVSHERETDESIHVSYLWLLAEMKFLQQKYPQTAIQPPINNYDFSDPSIFPGNDRTLVIFCRQYQDELGEPWGPSTLKNGGGGAGEAVIFLSREFAKMGYSVEVYGNPPPEDIGEEESSGVSWYPFWTYNTEGRPDVFVVWWHHLDVVELAKNARVRYVWLHYSQPAARYTPALMSKLKGVFVMSQFHAKQLPEHSKEKILVSSNGIDPSYFVDGPNKPLNFIYASHPFYGLETLLTAWPRIKQRVPEATLDVYYGFTQGVLRYLLANGERGRIYKENMDKLLAQDGVRYIGMVGQKDLVVALADSGFYLYPCEVSEISSISLMRAQALGTIPITSRYLESALPETSQYDLGPNPRPGLIGRNEEWLSEWVDAVVSAANNNTVEMTNHRIQMKDWARKTFPWSNVAKQWDQFFTEHLEIEKEERQVACRNDPSSQSCKI